MWALGVIVIIALVAAFLVLDGRSRPNRVAALDRLRPASHEPPAPEAAEEPDPEPAMRRPEEVERDVYRELYADRSGEVSRRRTAAG